MTSLDQHWRQYHDYFQQHGLEEGIVGVAQASYYSGALAVLLLLRDQACQDSLIREITLFGIDTENFSGH